MEYLFDPDKPYFPAWFQSCDHPFTGSQSVRNPVLPPKATHLYYAALCGFQDLIQHLVVKYPQHVNTSGGSFVTPLVAALTGRHFQTIKLHRHNGAHVDVYGNDEETSLLGTWNGDLEMVQVLLDCNAYVNAQGPENWTSPHNVAQGSRFSATSRNIPQSLPDVARLLPEHGADINARLDPVARGSGRNEGQSCPRGARAWREWQNPVPDCVGERRRRYYETAVRT